MAELVEAASRTGLVRFFPFKSVTMLRFATSPLWYQCEGQVAPVHIEVTSFPDRYLVCSGYFPSAELVLETGDPAAAAARAEELLVSWEPAPEDQDTLASRASLAHLTGKAGDAAGARDRFAALLPMCERVLGAEHPDALTVRSTLAHWTGRAGDAAGARVPLATLVPICERVLGPDHPDTLTTRASLAHWTGMAGDAAGARDRYATLLPIRERALGAEHPDTVVTHSNLLGWTDAAEGRGVD